MITIVNGDILNSTEDIIVQQVNCQNAMGSGLARAIFTKWYNVKTEYHKYCSSRTPEDLLGNVLFVDVEPNKMVANVFGQLYYGRKNVVYTSYEALDTAFSTIYKTYPDKSLAFPYKFGCGLAHGDWNTVYDLICRHFNNMNVTIYNKGE